MNSCQSANQYLRPIIWGGYVNLDGSNQEIDYVLNTLIENLEKNIQSERLFLNGKDIDETSRRNISEITYHLSINKPSHGGVIKFELIFKKVYYADMSRYTLSVGMIRENKFIKFPVRDIRVRRNLIPTFHNWLEISLAEPYHLAEKRFDDYIIALGEDMLSKGQARYARELLRNHSGAIASGIRMLPPELTAKITSHTPNPALISTNFTQAPFHALPDFFPY